MTGFGPCGSAAPHDTVTWAVAPRSLAVTLGAPAITGRPDDCPVVDADCWLSPASLRATMEKVYTELLSSPRTTVEVAPPAAVTWLPA